MPDSFNYTAFFDLDLTLTSETSGRLLARHAYKKGLMSESDLIKALWLSFAYRFSLMDPVKIVNKMASWVKGINEKDFNELADEILANTLLPSIYSQAAEEVNRHKNNNAATVILSSAPEYICKNVAKYLGINDVECTVLEVKEGFLTGRSVNPLCYGKEKVTRMRQYCEKNNSSLENSWYYGDSVTDSYALAIAGNPVCVNPDKKLRRKAEKEGWKIVNWEHSLI